MQPQSGVLAVTLLLGEDKHYSLWDALQGSHRPRLPPLHEHSKPA